MTSSRHLFYFICLGLFWGLSPSLYTRWGRDGIPVSHVIFWTGIGVGIVLSAMAWFRYGKVTFTKAIHFYGIGCALLINIPFGFSIYLAKHVPTTELALAISTSPLVSYALALLRGRETATLRRLAAIGLGLVSSAILIVTRNGMLSGHVSVWLVAAFALPFLYALYNWFTGVYWPENTDTLSIGASESFWSAIVVLPLFFLLAPPWSADNPPLWIYWSVAAAIIMWVMERIAYFTLIKEKGPVYTVQAVYLSTPTAVIFAALFYGGGLDIWLWLSLAILMGAIYLNNSGQAATPKSA